MIAPVPKKWKEKFLENTLRTCQSQAGTVRRWNMHKIHQCISKLSLKCTLEEKLKNWISCWFIFGHQESDAAKLKLKSDIFKSTQPTPVPWFSLAFSKFKMHLFQFIHFTKHMSPFSYLFSIPMVALFHLHCCIVRQILGTPYQSVWLGLQLLLLLGRMSVVLFINTKVHDTVESTRIEPFLGENRVILD